MIQSVGDFSKTLDNQRITNWVSDRDFRAEPDTSFRETLKLEESQPTRSFQDFLMESISKVNDLQKDANVAMEKLATGESQSIHDTMLAVEQAEIAFRMMNQLRQKVLDAYREVMKMQI